MLSSKCFIFILIITRRLWDRESSAQNDSLIVRRTRYFSKSPCALIFDPVLQMCLRFLFSLKLEE